MKPCERGEIVDWSSAWPPVGVVLLLATGLLSLVTADLQIIGTVAVAFSAGFIVGRFMPAGHPRTTMQSRGPRE